MNVTEKFFVDCLAAAIKGESVSFPEGLNYKQLYKLCKDNTAEVMVFTVLSPFKENLPAEFYERLKNSAIKNTAKDMRGVADAERVISEFEKSGVKFMPLKGYYLKKYYPKSEMRFATDFDILIDVNQIEKVRLCAEKLGMCADKESSHHYMFYFPETKTLFEFHKSIFEGVLNENFGTGFERAHLKDGYENFYELSTEDFYVSILAHSAFHFALEGSIGVRHVLDVYLYKNAHKFDTEYLNALLVKCGLLKFKENFELLADFLFEGATANDFTVALADYVINSAVFSQQNKETSDIASNSAFGKKPARLKTAVKLLFPPYSQMKEKYKAVKKCPPLLLFAYVFRFFEIFFRRPRSIKKLSNIKNAGKEQVAFMKTTRENLGLDNIKP